MIVQVVESASNASESAARLIEAQLRQGVSVLGVATGSTFQPVYERLVSAHRQRPFDTQPLHIVLLDEYVGLSVGHYNRYRSEIIRALAGPLGVPPQRVHAPDVDASDLDQACRQYDELLTGLGGVDLQLLGLGRNGHIGFNEPGADLSARTRLVQLARETRESNKSFFSGSEPPRQAVTQGIATILDAREVLLVATGSEKRSAVQRLLCRHTFDPDLPATALWQHKSGTAIFDRTAAGP